MSIVDTDLYKVLHKRETSGISNPQTLLDIADDLHEQILLARKEVAEGENPEEVLEDWFGLEPDYIFDLLE